MEAESLSFRETQGLVLLCCHCHSEATSQAAGRDILAVNHAASRFRSQSQRAHVFAHTVASELVLLQTTSSLHWFSTQHASSPLQTDRH